MQEGRRRAREVALQALYQLEISGGDSIDILARLCESFEIPKTAKKYAERIIAGVNAHKAELDKLIVTHAHHWKLDRISPVDRAVLQLGAYEIVHEPGVPAGVIINEAIEIAKRFGQNESGSFVNGILDSIAIAARGKSTNES